MADPNIRQIAAFAAIVEHGSATRAGEVIGLTQSALTQAIGRLEDALACRLFDRQPAGMRPTEPALLLAPRAAAALALIGSNRVTATQIRALLAFARSGSYSAAARAVGVAPASLHRSLADLSLALGERLIDRRGPHVFLTARGRKRARSFGVAMAELRSGFAEVEAWLGRAGGRIVIGAMPLSRARWLPAALRQFRAQQPDVQLVIVEGSHGELAGPLRDGEIDLILGALRDDALVEDLEQEAIFDDRPKIIVRTGHPLVSAPAPALETLAAAEWLMPPSGTPIRDLWEAMFREPGFPVPRVAIECGSPLTLRELILASDMMTLLSPDQMGVEIGQGLLAAMAPPLPIVRAIGITTRRGWIPTRSQAVMLAILRTAGRGLS